MRYESSALSLSLSLHEDMDKLVKELDEEGYLADMITRTMSLSERLRRVSVMGMVAIRSYADCFHQDWSGRGDGALQRTLSRLSNF